MRGREVLGSSIWGIRIDWVVGGDWGWLGMGLWICQDDVMWLLQDKAEARQTEPTAVSWYDRTVNVLGIFVMSGSCQQIEPGMLLCVRSLAELELDSAHAF